MPLKVVTVLIGIVAAIIAIVVLTNGPGSKPEVGPADGSQEQEQSTGGTTDPTKVGGGQDIGNTGGGSRPDRSEENPPAEFFNAAGSDERAIELADLTMQKMGGRAAWDSVRYVTWNFTPSARRYIWDRVRNVVRMEHITADPENEEEPAVGVLVFDLLRLTGRYWINGEEVLEQARISGMTQTGLRTWSNDSYWVFMPYKLKDSHTTIKYLGEREMTNGKPAEVIELTFRGIGISPQNKYHVYIAKDTGLVEQWDFFPNREDPAPRFQLPWQMWQRKGPVLLTGNHGDLIVEDIQVFEDVPDYVWTDGNPLVWTDLIDYVAEPKDPTDPKYLPGPIGGDASGDSQDDDS